MALAVLFEERRPSNNVVEFVAKYDIANNRDYYIYEFISKFYVKYFLFLLILIQLSFFQVLIIKINYCTDIIYCKIK